MAGKECEIEKEKKARTEVNKIVYNWMISLNPQIFFFYSNSIFYLLITFFILN
jgi:hypothetical protein